MVVYILLTCLKFLLFFNEQLLGVASNIHFFSVNKWTNILMILMKFDSANDAIDLLVTGVAFEIHARIYFYSLLVWIVWYTCARSWKALSLRRFSLCWKAPLLVNMTLKRTQRKLNINKAGKTLTNHLHLIILLIFWLFALCWLIGKIMLGIRSALVIILARITSCITHSRSTKDSVEITLSFLLSWVNRAYSVLQIDELFS